MPLTNYLVIRDSENLKQILASDKSEEERVNTLFTDILNEIKLKSGKNIVEKKQIDSELLVSEEYQYHFPVDPKLDFLKPFNTNSDRQFVCFTDGNPVFDECLKPEQNKFITELLKLLFFPSTQEGKSLAKTRYNVNVIRPLRNTLQPISGIIPDIKSLFKIKISSKGDESNETNGGSKKVMLDTSLIGTLEGFCNITRSDT